MVDPEQLQWIKTATQHQVFLAKGHEAGDKLFGRATQEPEEMFLGTQVFVETQQGPTEECSRLVIEVHYYALYMVTMDGSG